MPLILVGKGEAGMITPSSLCSLHFSPTYTGTLVPTVAQERDKRKNRGEETDPAGKGQTHTHTHALKSSAALPRTYLQLPQGVVAFLLARSLLGAQSDELVDALRHSSVAETESISLLHFCFVKINSNSPTTYCGFTRNAINSL